MGVVGDFLEGPLTLSVGISTSVAMSGESVGLSGRLCDFVSELARDLALPRRRVNLGESIASISCPKNVTC